MLPAWSPVGIVKQRAEPRSQCDREPFEPGNVDKPNADQIADVHPIFIPMSASCGRAPRSHETSLWTVVDIGPPPLVQPFLSTYSADWVAKGERAELARMYWMTYLRGHDLLQDGPCEDASGGADP